MNVVVLVSSVEPGYVQTIINGKAPYPVPLVGDIINTFDRFATVTRRTFIADTNKYLGIYLDVEFLPEGEAPIGVPTPKSKAVKVASKSVNKRKRSK
jgi:hypothetical protein